MRNIIFAIALFFTIGARASEPDIAGVFLPPNERHPIMLLQQLEEYIEGALISVGTERGLMTVAIAKKVTALVQVDYDPETVLYNEINRELLKISTSRLDYFNLRMSLSFESWKTRGAGTLLANESNFEFFRDQISREGFDLFQNPNPPREPNVGLKPFAGGNYLFDDRAFARVHQMAKADKIEVYQLDLKNAAAVEALIARLSKTTAISLFDVSNAWWGRYAGHDAILAIAGNLALRNQKTRMVLTYRKSQLGWGYEAPLVTGSALSETMHAHTINRLLTSLCDQNLIGGEWE